ncbi:MAG: AAA domain-containing protein [Desulfobacterales bacterium]|nr:AAA domain-containing protein [Desulfobacterales bacterium]MCP4162015.1 AAA domain-containing protein [Deltaproteobacteria bacterium]
MNGNLEQAVSSIKEGLKIATKGLVEREILADLIILSAVASEHLLIVGPPGTAKSEAVRRVSSTLGGKYFEYLLGRYTEPGEIFGPVDLRKLKEGFVETETTGMLPEAEIAFLDEVFLGSTAILNTLLGILNERTFRRGNTKMKCPLKVCVGATNMLPDDESLAAFSDRFLLNHFVEPVSDSLLEHLLDGGWQVRSNEIVIKSSISDLETLIKAAKAANFSSVRSDLAHAIRVLRKAGINLSDRRIVKCQSVVAAAAVLAGRENPQRADLWSIIYVIPTADGQKLAREVLKDILEPSENVTLKAAAEAASLGPAARIARIVETGKALLTPETKSDSWKLELEALAREIDAGFSADNMTEELTAIRTKIVGMIEQNENQI